MSLIGLIEGIMYLTKSDEEFYNTYMVGEKQVVLIGLAKRNV
jgi:hypothetical protein